MMGSMVFFFSFIPLLSFILLTVNFILAPHRPYKEKKTPFKCGYHSFISQNRTQFTISLFIFTLLFLIFGLEIVLIYPFSVSSYANKVYGLIVIFIFTLVAVGFIYELRKSALKIQSKKNVLKKKFWIFFFISLCLYLFYRLPCIIFDNAFNTKTIFIFSIFTIISSIFTIICMYNIKKGMQYETNLADLYLPLFLLCSLYICVIYLKYNPLIEIGFKTLSSIITAFSIIKIDWEILPLGNILDNIKLWNDKIKQLFNELLNVYFTNKDFSESTFNWEGISNKDYKLIKNGIKKLFSNLLPEYDVMEGGSSETAGKPEAIPLVNKMENPFGSGGNGSGGDGSDGDGSSGNGPRRNDNPSSGNDASKNKSETNSEIEQQENTSATASQSTENTPVTSTGTQPNLSIMSLANIVHDENFPPTKIHRTIAPKPSGLGPSISDEQIKHQEQQKQYQEQQKQYQEQEQYQEQQEQPESKKRRLYGPVPGSFESQILSTYPWRSNSSQQTPINYARLNYPWRPNTFQQTPISYPGLNNPPINYPQRSDTVQEMSLQTDLILPSFDKPQGGEWPHKPVIPLGDGIYRIGDTQAKIQIVNGTIVYINIETKNIRSDGLIWNRRPEIIRDELISLLSALLDRCGVTWLDSSIVSPALKTHIDACQKKMAWKTLNGVFPIKRSIIDQLPEVKWWDE